MHLRGFPALFVLSALLHPACSPPSPYICNPARSCELPGRSGGACLLAPDGNSCCAFPAATDECPSGFRFDPAGAPGVAGSCVACSAVCSPNHIQTPTCSDGKCTGVCDEGWADCDGDKRNNGCQVNTDGDLLNCGACSRDCSTTNITRSCTSGMCDGVCHAYFADCDGNKQANGCEVNTQTTVEHCGGCGTRCSSNHIKAPTRNAGKCDGVCDVGWGDCNDDKTVAGNGCEVDIQTSLAHCGACRKLCSSDHIAKPTRTAGVCDDVCDPGRADCDGDKATNGCEAKRGTCLPPSCQGGLAA